MSYQITSAFPCRPITLDCPKPPLLCILCLILLPYFAPPSTASHLSISFYLPPSKIACFCSYTHITFYFTYSISSVLSIKSIVGVITKRKSQNSVNFRCIRVRIEKWMNLGKVLHPLLIPSKLVPFYNSLLLFLSDFFFYI